MATNTDPVWYQNMLKGNAVHTEEPKIENPNTIRCLAGGEEMLRVSDKGFWVRGVKVEQDEQEAQKVYEGFKAWMMWAQMSRDYN